MAINRLHNLNCSLSSSPYPKSLTLSSNIMSSFSDSASTSSPSMPITSKFKILDKKIINHDCYIYMLGWAGPKFKLSIGQHFRIV